MINFRACGRHLVPVLLSTNPNTIMMPMPTPTLLGAHNQQPNDSSSQWLRIGRPYSSKGSGGGSGSGANAIAIGKHDPPGTGNSTDDDHFAPASPEDERSLDEEIPQQQPTVVNQMASRRRTNCAVYGAGLASTGALAIAKLVKSPTAPQCLIKPMRISKMNVHRIRHVAAGCGFSLFASSTELYGSGLNNFYQLCGPRRMNEEQPPDPVAGYGPRVADMWYLQGCRIMLPSDAGNIRSISAGRMHSVVLTSENKIFCFGSNTHGQCGVNPLERAQVTLNRHQQLGAMADLPVENDERIVKVHACLDTTFALTSHGRVFAWGLGTDGQLGNGNGQMQWQPALVKGDLQGERCTHIGGSTDTLIALNEKGDIFVWGQNEYGQLGAVSDEPQIFFPQHVPFKVGKAVGAEATGCSCIVCNSEGHVFTWGSHVLGFGPKVERLDRPMQLDPPLFASTMREEHQVRKIFAGNCCMGALTEAGHMFAWGSNRHGLLALGHRQHQHFPFQVSFAETVKQASFGPDHSLFVTNRY